MTAVARRAVPAFALAAVCGGIVIAADPIQPQARFEGIRINKHYDEQKKKYVTNADDVTILITKRDKDKFEGEWWIDRATKKIAIAGTVKPNGVINFEFGKILAGQFPKNTAGNVVLSGELNAAQDAIVNGKLTVKGAERTGTWEAKLKK